MNPSKSLSLALAVLGTVTCVACAAEAQELLSRKDKQEAVRAIAEAYERQYVFPDMGKKPVQADLYILTDGYTFSAAEGLAYDLQALKRAVIAGTPSAGGAHATEIHTVLDSYTLWIPVAFSKNPVTGTNFQGKGVQPDIKVSGETAIQQVQLHALEKRIEKESDPERKAELERICREIRNGLGAASETLNRS
jgi:C-terminal processing protease CtpA/Prc